MYYMQLKCVLYWIPRYNLAVASETIYDVPVQLMQS